MVVSDTCWRDAIACVMARERPRRIERCREVSSFQCCIDMGETDEFLKDSGEEKNRVLAYPLHSLYASNAFWPSVFHHLHSLEALAAR